MSGPFLRAPKTTLKVFTGSPSELESNVSKWFSEFGHMEIVDIKVGSSPSGKTHTLFIFYR